MVYAEKMSLGTNMNGDDGKTPLWKMMDREAWKQQTFYTLQRYPISVHTHTQTYTHTHTHTHTYTHTHTHTPTNVSAICITLFNLNFITLDFIASNIY